MFVVGHEKIIGKRVDGCRIHRCLSSATDVSVQPQPSQAETQWQPQESAQFYSGSYPAQQPVGALNIQWAVEQCWQQPQQVIQQPQQVIQ